MDGVQLPRVDVSAWVVGVDDCALLTVVVVDVDATALLAALVGVVAVGTALVLVSVATWVTASPPVISSMPDTLAAPTVRRARRAG
ncbi:MAG: hypothetical protein M3Z46_06030 [Actinomycetota bacterium]|nr:hypothetical protein [Actinomycetota bacterium]